MSALKNVINQHQFATELHSLVEVSQEVSIMSMQRVRSSILSTRSYMEGIMDIFKDVRSSHQAQIQKLLAKRQQPRNLLGLTKKKALTILLTPSGKFSGPLVRQIISEFNQYQRQTPTDVAVVGTTGRELTQNSISQRNTRYFSVNLEHPSTEEINELLSYILQYDSITVFTGQFQNLVLQQPTAFNISGHDSLISQAKVDQTPRTFIFEPKLEKIVAYFDAQVTASLFRQTLDESKLANLGSRIMALESSLGGIQIELATLKKKVRQAHRKLENRKQFNRMSGMAMWH